MKRGPSACGFKHCCCCCRQMRAKQSNCQHRHAPFRLATFQLCVCNNNNKNEMFLKQQQCINLCDWGARSGIFRKLCCISKAIIKTKLNHFVGFPISLCERLKIANADKGLQRFHLCRCFQYRCVCIECVYWRGAKMENITVKSK